METNDIKSLTVLLKDLIRINVIVATELIQLVENSSESLRGKVPDSCRAEHRALKREIIETAEKHGLSMDRVRSHNLAH